MAYPPYKYRALEPSSSTEGITPPLFQNRVRIYFQYFAIILLTAILSSLGTYSILLRTRSLSLPSPSSPQTCGNSTSSALSLGCTFDPLTFMWLPKSCPREYTEDFIQYNGQNGEKPWRYWLDANGTVEESNYDELSMMADTGEFYYTTQGEHLTHCAFMLLRFRAVMAKDEKVDSMSANDKHAAHCIRMLLAASRNVPTWDIIGTAGGVYFGSC